MSATSKVTVAQIGVGYWGPNLLRNLVSNGDCTVKTVADLSEDRRAFVEGLYPGVETTEDYRSVLADADIDAVIIATPPETHFEIAVSALEAGKHILVEKPMANTIEEVERIGELAAAKGLVAMVGDTFLYNAAVRYLKSYIDSGEAGEIRYIFSQRVNLGRIRQDVDALWNLAPHDISIIQYLLGNPEPVAVSRHGMDYIQKGIDDLVFMHIQYPQKVVAHIHVSWLDPQKIRRMTVVGTKKMVIYDDIAENKIAIFDKGIEPRAVLGENMDFDRPDFVVFDYRRGDVLLPKINFTEPLRVEIEHFLDCIMNGTPCLTDVNHAKGVVRILSSA